MIPKLPRTKWKNTHQPTPPATQSKARWGAGMAGLAVMVFEFVGLWANDQLTIEYVLWYLGEHREVLAAELGGTVVAVYTVIYGAQNKVKQKVSG